MDRKKVFAILGIAETKEEGLIKGAYREKIVSVNPEDNPEGFKRLREAYEGALAYAREVENGQNESHSKNDPVSQYLEKVDQVYTSLSRRLNAEEWEKLVREEVLDDLDLGEDAKWGLFSYLASHYRMPSDIWKVLDRVFGFVENEQKFKEHLNVNFVDYMCRRASEHAKASEFPYRRFSGEDTADYDVFLARFDELVNLMRKGSETGDREGCFQEIAQKIAFLDSLGISHPWLALEKARYELYTGKKEEAEAHMRKLLEHEPGDHRIALLGAEVLHGCGYEDEAVDIYEDFLHWDGLSKDEIYTASAALAEIYAGREDFLKARENGIRAWNLYDTDKVSQLMERINTGVIEQYTGEETKNLTTEEGVRLAWCFLQTKRAQEGWDFFGVHPVLEEDTAECHWAKAALALECGQSQTAVREAAEWRRFLLTDEDDNGEEQHPTDKKEHRIAQSHLLEGKGWQTLYGKEEDKDGEAASGYKRAALEAFEKAIALQPENFNFLMAKMLFERELHDYEEMANLCERMKELDRGFYWAYFYGQEAYEGLRRAQKVVDTFYDARKIYAGHADIYERAVKVFWDYGQYSDAQNIIRQADEANVSSFYLTLKKLELCRRFAADEQAFREADEQAARVIAEFEEQKAPEKLLAEAYMERAWIQDDYRAADFRDPDKIEEWAKRSLELDDCPGIRYFLGRYYLNYRKDGKTAYVHLKICEEQGMTFHWMYFYIARCKEEFEEWDAAIQYYKKAAEKAPEERDFPWRIAWLYRQKFIRTGQRVYCDEALRWLQLQKEKFGEDARNLWQISDIHARLGEYETALEEIERALKDNRRGRNLGHKAKMLNMLGRVEEAVPIYEDAIEVTLKNGVDYEYSYTQMEQYFLEKEDYEGGVCWFTRMTQEKVVTEKQRHDNQDKIRNFYLKLKQWEKALDIVRTRYGGNGLSAEERNHPLDLTKYVCASWDMEGERIEDLLTVYKYALPCGELREKCRLAEALLEGDGAEALEESFNGKRGAYGALGRVYANFLLDDEKALVLFQKSLEQIHMGGDEIEVSDYRLALEDAMKCCYRLGKTEDAKRYGEQLEESISKDYEECGELEKDWKELFANAEGCSRRNLYDLFCICYHSGAYEQARQYLKQMEECRWCWWCSSRRECTELWECKGYIALLDGNREEAASYFERAAEGSRTRNPDAARELLRLWSGKKNKKLNDVME